MNQQTEHKNSSQMRDDNHKVIVGMVKQLNKNKGELMATTEQFPNDSNVQTVLTELTTAQANFPAFHSEHEGFAVLKEEVDELWEAVRLKQSDPLRAHKVKKEAIQVAAMALRFLDDLC